MRQPTRATPRHPQRRRGPTDERHDDDAAIRHGSRRRRAPVRPVRATYAHERPHGLGLVVDSVHRAGDLPQAPAPSAPGDLLVTTGDDSSPGRRGTPGGLFRVPGRIRAPDGPVPPARPAPTPHHVPPAPPSDEAHDETGDRQCSHSSTPQSSKTNPGGSTRAAPTRPSALVDLFFSEQLDDILRAKAFCVECPVQGRVPRRRRSSGGSRGACGVASSSPTARCSRNKRRRGRPPKVRPPEPVLEELVPRYDPQVRESA